MQWNLLKIREIPAAARRRSMESCVVSVRIAALSIRIELRAQSEVEKELARRNHEEGTAVFGLGGVCYCSRQRDGWRGQALFETRGVGSRLHVNLHGLRVDSIGDNDQLVVARGNRVRHVEMSMIELFSRGHGHRDVRSAVGIEHVAGGQEQESAVEGERIGSVRWR
jgi:hypothetical protein